MIYRFDNTPTRSSSQLQNRLPRRLLLVGGSLTALTLTSLLSCRTPQPLEKPSDPAAYLYQPPSETELFFAVNQMTDPGLKYFTQQSLQQLLHPNGNSITLGQTPFQISPPRFEWLELPPNQSGLDAQAYLVETDQQTQKVIGEDRVVTLQVPNMPPSYKPYSLTFHADTPIGSRLAPTVYFGLSRTLNPNTPLLAYSTQRTMAIAKEAISLAFIHQQLTEAEESLRQTAETTTIKLQDGNTHELITPFYSDMFNNNGLYRFLADFGPFIYSIYGFRSNPLYISNMAYFTTSPTLITEVLNSQFSFNRNSIIKQVNDWITNHLELSLQTKVSSHIQGDPRKYP